MPRWLPLLLGGIGLLALLLWLSARDPMPGDLAAPHASVPALSGLRGCDACHGEPGFESACLDCHPEIETQFAGARGLHFAFHEDGESDCSRCHREHLGHDFELVSESSWRGAGPDGFAHDHVDFALGAAHDALDCSACHAPEHAGDRWPRAVGAAAPRERSFLGLSQDCVACHDDVHGDGTSDRCADCHGQERFAPASRFDHDATFALRDAHALAACGDCHRGLPETADAVPSRGVPLPFDDVAGTTCAACHESPHLASKERAYGDDCRRCHDERAFVPARFPAERHAASFPLDAAHRELACAACHAPMRRPHGTGAMRSGAARGVAALVDLAELDGIAPHACGRCHDNAHVHGGSAIRIERASASNCGDCHGGGSWRVPGFAEKVHVDAGFPLDAAHAEVRCAECHRPDLGLVPDATRSCRACHDDPHASPLADSCTPCHRLEDRRWQRGALRLDPDAHTRTGFELVAPHADLDCAKCHVEAAAYADRFPGRAGDACGACHADPHAGQFVARGDACVDCHEGTSFVPTAFTVEDHEAYPLEGAHLAVSCVRCHERSRPDAPRRFVGTPSRCASCHEDPHGGRFDRQVAIGDCKTCHATPRDWRVEGFDHAITGYPLEGAHARAECADCHRDRAGGAGSAAADHDRFPTAPRDCRACHRDPHFGQLTHDRDVSRSRRPTAAASCTRCHDSFERWTANAFDHDTDARFPLDGVHRRVACAKCHPSRRAPDGTAFIHYRPLGTSCEDCHAVR